MQHIMETTSWKSIILIATAILLSSDIFSQKFQTLNGKGEYDCQKRVFTLFNKNLVEFEIHIDEAISNPIQLLEEHFVVKGSEMFKQEAKSFYQRTNPSYSGVHICSVSKYINGALRNVFEYYGSESKGKWILHHSKGYVDNKLKSEEELVAILADDSTMNESNFPKFSKYAILNATFYHGDGALREYGIERGDYFLHNGKICVSNWEMEPRFYLFEWHKSSKIALQDLFDLNEHPDTIEFLFPGTLLGDNEMKIESLFFLYPEVNQIIKATKCSKSELITKENISSRIVFARANGVLYKHKLQIMHGDYPLISLENDLIHQTTKASFNYFDSSEEIVSFKYKHSCSGKRLPFNGIQLSKEPGEWIRARYERSVKEGKKIENVHGVILANYSQGKLDGEWLLFDDTKGDIILKRIYKADNLISEFEGGAGEKINDIIFQYYKCIIELVDFSNSGRIG